MNLKSGVNDLKRINRLRIIIAVFVLLWIAALTVFGLLLSLPEKQSVFSFPFSLQNAIETVLMNPIADLRSIPFQGCINRFFIIASAITPVFGLVFLLTFAKPFVKHLIVIFSIRKNRVLIIGENNPDIKRILLNKYGKSKLVYLTNEVIDKETDNEFLLRNVIVKNIDYYKSENGNGTLFSKRMNRFLKKFDNVILLDEYDLHNIQNYAALSSMDCCKKRTIHFHVHIDSLEMKYHLMNYFDSTLLENKSQGALMDLHIFNLQQITAETALERLPVHREVNGNNYNVHALIVGAGRFGEAMLCHLINQSVITADNNILIDIIDRRINGIDFIRDRLLKRFGAKNDCVEFIEKSNGISVKIKKNAADGNLEIRVRRCNVYGDIQSILKELSKDNPFTYIAVCLPDANANLHTVNELKEYVTRKAPLAVRMTDSNEVKTLIKNITSLSDENVALIGERDEYVGINEIINRKKEAAIRTYNLEYNNFQADFDISDKSNNAEELWNRQVYYKRQSNRSLFYHEPVKKLYIQNNGSIKDDYKKFKENANAIKNLYREVSNTLLKAMAETVDKKQYDSDICEKLERGLKAKIYSSLPEDLSSLMAESTSLVDFAKAEHRRWDYYFITEGWDYGFKEDTPEKSKPQSEKEKEVEQLINSEINSLIKMNKDYITSKCKDYRLLNLTENSKQTNKDPIRKKHDCILNWDGLCKKKPDVLVYDLLSFPELDSEEMKKTGGRRDVNA